MIRGRLEFCFRNINSVVHAQRPDFEARSIPYLEVNPLLRNASEQTAVSSKVPLTATSFADLDNERSLTQYSLNLDLSEYKTRQIKCPRERRPRQGSLPINKAHGNNRKSFPQPVLLLLKVDHQRSAKRRPCCQTPDSSWPA